MWRGRRFWIILLATPFVLAAADTLYWYIAERNLQTRFSAWLDERRAQGWTVTTEAPQPGGWPLAAMLTVHRAALKGGDPPIPGGLAWRADGLVLRVPLWRPRTLEIAAHGEQQLRLGDGPMIPFSADRLNIAIPLEAGALPRFLDFAAQNLHVGLTMRGDANASMV